MARARSYNTPVRKKKLPKYQSFRLTRRIQPEKIRALPSAIDIWKDTWRFLWLNKIQMFKFLGIYALTYLVLVKGLNNFTVDVQGLKDRIESIGNGNIGSIFGALGIYATLLTSLTTTTNDVTNYFQISILVLFSLSFIWLVRKLHQKNRPYVVRDSFYVGMRPLVPFLLVLSVMIFELLPMGIGGLLLATVQGASVINAQAEVTGLAVLMILMFVLSVYLLAGTAFAVYIVTLPDATPMMAIKSSMRLLRIHRWIVFRKIVAFFFLLILAGFLAVLPFIIWLPKFAEIAFFVMGCASFGVTHTYMYKLYRSMIS